MAAEAGRAEEAYDPSDELVGDLAFRHDLDLPTVRPERLDAGGIPAAVRLNLADPKAPVRRWDRRFGASVVPVPEAAVNENGLSPAGEDDVRGARQPSPMDAEPVPNAWRSRRTANSGLVFLPRIRAISALRASEGSRSTIVHSPNYGPLRRPPSPSERTGIALTSQRD